MSVVIMAQVEQIFSLIKYKNEGTRTIHGFCSGVCCYRLFYVLNIIGKLVFALRQLIEKERP